ncbi:Chitotriosidase-1 [Hypsibius exemplaris]|uniref:Chitotriosidase-1 n=1 Tax=Hypsibius exemplaris TaxID=2072580 RepID=A0A1W0WP60_HYPEX|nr:Chitotriosidase-1 [Hypsibius exemplaris]
MLFSLLRLSSIALLSVELITAYNDPVFELPHRGCYYTNWSQYRKGKARFTVEDIDPALCTYIVVAFGKIDNNSLTTLEWNDEVTFRELVGLKDEHPRLKILLSVGGWTLSQQLIAVSSTAENRRTFAISAVSNLRYWELDGLDIDWEYPDAAMKHQYSELLLELRSAFEKESRQSGQARLALAAAVHFTSDGGYDGRVLNQTLDFVNVMTYDLHGAWVKDKVGHQAPLFKGPFGAHSKESVSAVARAWEHLGVTKSKLVIGLPMYGRGWQLTDSGRHKLGSTAKGPINASNFTGEAGAWPYFEICERLRADNATYVYDENIQAEYAFTADFWIGYDDRATILAKTKWAKSSGYGGVYVWDLAQDDFLGTCGLGPFPLLGAVHEVLVGPRQWKHATRTSTTASPLTSPSTTTTPFPTIPTTQATTSTTVTTTSRSSSTTTSTTGAAITRRIQPLRQSKVPATRNTAQPRSTGQLTSKSILPKPSIGKQVCDKSFCLWTGPGSFAVGKCDVRYCDCDAGSNPYVRECIGGLVYDTVSKYCNWQENVEGCTRFSSSRN